MTDLCVLSGLRFGRLSFGQGCLLQSSGCFSSSSRLLPRRHLRHLSRGTTHICNHDDDDDDEEEEEEDLWHICTQYCAKVLGTHD